ARRSRARASLRNRHQGPCMGLFESSRVTHFFHPRVLGSISPDRESLDNEIARLRGLDGGELRARWHTVFRRRAPPHLPRHLLFRILAYRLQADRLGQLDNESRRLLDRIGSGSAERIGRLVADLNLPRTELPPGTLL